MDAEFVQDLLKVLDQTDQAKVKSMFLNYKIDSFEDAFEMMNYRLKQNNPGFEDAGFAV